MKKRIMMFLVCCTVFFCACGKSEEVKAVEDLISKIGTVTFSSSEDIQNAQNAYDALSDEDQKKVGNYQTLEDAKKAFDALGTQITLENYTNYLNVSVDTKLDGGMDFGTYMGNGTTIGTYVYDKINCAVNVSGKSKNYDYNNVAVTVHFSGSYIPLYGLYESDEEYIKNHLTDIDFDLIANADIVGDGYAENIIEVPDGYYLFNSSACVEVQYEIVDVSGVMTSVK